MRFDRQPQMLIFVLCTYFLSQADFTEFSSLDDLYQNVTRDVSLPLTKGETSLDDAESSINFLKLPKWSKGYVACSNNKSEVSCFEIVRAAKTIRGYENNIISTTKGHVYVKAGNQSLQDRMTMLYHAFIIGIATNRTIHIDKESYSDFDIPDVIQSMPNEVKGRKIEYSPYFACNDISVETPDLIIDEGSWPQAFYIHHDAARFLKEHFGYHAAYFIGNYLFGSNMTKELCISKYETIVEGWKWEKSNFIAPPSKYGIILKQCVAKGEELSLVTNEKSEFPKDLYPDQMKINSDSDTICALRKLTSSQKIIQTYGSRLGFWATALQGQKGSFVNSLDNVCFDFHSSQQGSAWTSRMYKWPEQAEIFLFNSFTLFCQDNNEEVQNYVDYLLW